MKTFAIGDIHGAYHALIQVLDRCNFNKEEDRLICLGDVCDGWPYVPECFDELLTIKNMDYIMGNHDWWAMETLIHGKPAEEIWLSQGGKATYDSYKGKMPQNHADILLGSSCAIEDGKNIFSHGGINPNQPFYMQIPTECMWDRRLVTYARHRDSKGYTNYKYGNYDAIFVGHTTTYNLNKTNKPAKFCNVWCLDTGAGWNGYLTIMDVDTKEFWQSDNVVDLMPDVQGRGLRF